MSSHPSGGAQGRSSPPRLQDSTDIRSEPSSFRKRSNTRHRTQPPAIHLSLKTSSSTAQTPATVNLNQEDVRTPRTGNSSARSNDPQSSGGHSSRSGQSNKHSGMSPSFVGKYGTHTTSSPLTEASLSDYLSSSLPVSLSPLSLNTDIDLELSSPASSRPSTREKPSPPFLTSHGSSTLHPPPASRAASAPGSRKSSAASLDRDAILHLDMKRLLSKPALPSHSGSSIISIPSDHDASSASPSPRHPRSFAELSKVTSRRLDSGNMTDGGTSPSPLRTLREVASRSSLPSEAREVEPKAVHKVRNVLRRRPSSRSNPSTPTAATFRAATEDPNNTPRSPRVAPVHSGRSAAPKRAASATAEPVSVDRVRRREKAPVGLTPAGAVAHAYKQQEQRREELAEISGWNEQIRQENSFRSGNTSLRSGDLEEDEEEGGAYYSVFGSSSGRLVAVGSAEDSSWALDYDGKFEHDERIRQAGRPSTSGPRPVVGVRTLSRKVSGRFKKVAGSAKRDREVSPHGTRRISESNREDWTPYDGRPSMQVSKRSLGASMDGFVDVQRQVSTGSTIPSIPNGKGEKERRELRTLRSMRSLKGKEKDAGKFPDGEASPGGKLWKLVKRISTGGLRDKYAHDSAPPPVPALPKDFQHLASSRTTLDIRKPSGRETPPELDVARFIQSRSSMSAVRPSSAPQKESPRSERPASRPSTGARPSTTTRSSSPMSSDMASSRFFHKTHSAHSSISSYGEELPPLPQLNVGHHIMSPSELYRLNHDCPDDSQEKNAKRNRTRSQSAAATTSPRPGDQPVPSLPPPRRSNTAGNTSNTPVYSGESPPSPTIPTFSTDDPINNFTLASRLSLPMSEFGILSENTPPRPRRSSRRKPVPSELISPTLSTPVSPPMPVTPRTPRTPSLPSVSIDGSRSSIFSHSSRAETIHSATLPASHLRSPLRFRELESPRSQLSEREKAAKWDDLLERSNRAGGTLHLGESGLMSDNVRFSEYSELSDTTR